ncbi:MAG: ribonuclease HIII [Bacilli bacterium]|nr:ribonuclease HIII [Bacilli bacterium]
MENVVIKVDKNLLDNLKNKYEEYQIDRRGEYILSCYDYHDIIITIWESKKSYFKVQFSGPGALKEAQNWDMDASIKETKKVNKEHFLDLDEQIGSDEVGVGDLFMPMIVVGAYTSKEDIKKLQSLGIHDSKKLSDTQIEKLGPTLIKNFHYSKLTLSNEKYNEMLLKGENINSLKARMHNQVLKNLLNKFPNTKHIYIDQFVNEKKYYEYLENKDIPLNNVIFKEKGESYYPSIALASVIARYALIIYKKELEKEYHLSFPLGAGKKADEFLNMLLDKYPLEEIEKLLKNNFANYKRIKKGEN